MNKLIVKDFPKNTSIEQELLKYRLLNIFYNREKEIEMLRRLELEEREIIQSKEAYKLWIKKAEKNFNELLYEKSSFDVKIQNRLKMIKKHWINLTVFHYIPGAPATNNAIENYYSTSLKTHGKKQFRTDTGIVNQIRLSSMKRAGMFDEPKTTLLELFRLFIPFINY